ncbi:MAG TPA: YciC family protein [Solirubrobacterales bacterium]|nr:YciC family protein [Solirubrobacterales bacterium]
MEMANPPVKRLEPGRVISETFSVYRDNLGPLLGSALLVFAVVELISLLLSEADSDGLLLLAIPLSLAGHALYTGVVVKLVQDVRDGRRDSTVGDLFSAAAPAIGSLVLFTILYTVGVAIGFILLVVPGLILLTIWSLGPPAIVVERVGAIEAFGRSRSLVKGVGWSVFLVLFITFLIAAAVGIAVGALGLAISDGAGIAYLASVIASALTAPIASLAVAIMYFELGGGVSEAPQQGFDVPPSAA